MVLIKVYESIKYKTVQKFYVYKKRVRNTKIQQDHVSTHIPYYNTWGTLETSFGVHINPGTWCVSTIK